MLSENGIDQSKRGGESQQVHKRELPALLCTVKNSDTQWFREGVFPVSILA